MQQFPPEVLQTECVCVALALCGEACADVGVTQVTQKEEQQHEAESAPSLPCAFSLHTGGPGQPLPWPGRGFLQPTSLTLLYPLASPSNSTDVYVEPMEIATFRLRLG